MAADYPGRFRYKAENEKHHLSDRWRLKIEFHAVLFDLDGTLLDTLADIAGAANAALERLGFLPHPVESYRRFVGDGAGCLARRVLGEGRDDDQTVEQCRRAIAEEYQRCWADTTRPYPGVPKLVAELRARGVPMAVLSNKPHEATATVVEFFFPENPFRIVRGAQPGVPIKPDPTEALQIAAELSVEPGRFIYLGDTDTDMQTAVAAGMYPAGALWGFRTAEELTATGARTLLKTPAEVLSLLCP
ncbi:MAG: HAD family hydrolase [Planctomycetota bacterium]